MTEQAAAGQEMFIPLADYIEPSMPAQELLHKLLGRVQALLARSDPKPFIADEPAMRYPAIPVQTAFE